ncbi:MAG: CARDB domain-containing protein [archaeon]
MKKHIFLIFVLTLFIIIGIGSAHAVTIDDVFKALNDALTDKKIDAAEQANILGLLDLYLTDKTQNTTNGSTETVGYLPDLSVDSITLVTPEKVFEGDSITVDAVIKNNGDKEVQMGASEVSLYLNDVLLVPMKSGVEIDPGYSEKYFYDQGASGLLITNVKGTNRIKVCADVNKVIGESNEQNNCLEKNITVYTAPLVVTVDFSMHKDMFPVDAWGYRNAWGDCSTQSGGWDGANKICKYKGQEGALTVAKSPCYHEDVSTKSLARWILLFDAGGAPIKGSQMQSGTAFMQVRCYSKT